MKPISIKVEEFTTVNPITVSQEDSLDKVKTIMMEKDIRHLPVIDNGQPVGIISNRDVNLTHRFDLNFKLKAKDIMTADPYTVSFEANLDDVAFEMSRNKYGSAIVMDNNDEVYGIFTSTDALNALIEVLRKEA